MQCFLKILYVFDTSKCATFIKNIFDSSTFQPKIKKFKTVICFKFFEGGTNWKYFYRLLMEVSMDYSTFVYQSKLCLKVTWNPPVIVCSWCGKVHIFWEVHKILFLTGNIRMRFRKILWPSQNIWNLVMSLSWDFPSWAELKSFRTENLVHFVVEVP